jgi:hypothetical protein
MFRATFQNKKHSTNCVADTMLPRGVHRQSLKDSGRGERCAVVIGEDEKIGKINQ